MFSDTNEPYWDVCNQGYDWHKERGYVQPTFDFVLTENRPSGAREAHRRINLYDLDARLFSEFAQLGVNPEGIRQFANQYGFLGLKAQKKKPGRNDPHVETLYSWAHEITEMRIVVTLWSCCQAGTRDILADYIHWANDGRWVRFQDVIGAEYNGNRLDFQHMIVKSTGGGLPELISKGDLVLPAVAFVQDRLNQKLEESGIRPRLVWQQDKNEGKDSHRLDLQTTIGNLHQALWLQVATHIGKGDSFKKCVLCERWFAVSPKAPRSSSEFCTDACRVRAYRVRQDKARQRAAAGESYEVIAEELGSDVNVVKRWITGRKESDT